MGSEVDQTKQHDQYSFFYRFTKRPFQPTPDVDFLFLSPSHEKALASITSGIRYRQGLIVITGEVGLGKTTILHSYLKASDQNKQKTIHISNPQLTFERLLSTILNGLGAEPVGGEAADLVSQLHELLLAEHRRNETVMLLIDEAQNMPVDTLASIRTLSNLETSAEKLIQIVLVGQPELETLLNRHELRQVGQRIAVHTKLLPLTKKQSLAYIEHRLACVGAKADSIFSKGALNLIVKSARGIPRTLNILCDNALLTGFSWRVQSTIPRMIAKVVTAELDRQQGPAFWRNRTAFRFVAILTLTLPIMLFLGFGLKIDWNSLSEAWLDWTHRSQKVISETFLPEARTPIKLDTDVHTARQSAQLAVPAISPQAVSTAQAATETSLSTSLKEKAELGETARLLAVLLDCGRVVIGRAQPTINNPRLEDKGFSSSVFEGRLRNEFLTRTGHDLRNLAPATMPERAKPLLVRLAFFMQKAVQEVQSDINKKGIGFKGFIPATFGTKVAERFSKDTGLKLRQIGPPGIEPRNPNNKPDEEEEEALFAIQKSHPRVGDHVIEQQLPDNGIRVLLPLFYAKQCLACHGRPKGEVDISGYEKEGFKEGDLGGAISIRLPSDRRPRPDND
jgi:type II secretory pathway predicted ATPase ExeA